MTIEIGYFFNDICSSTYGSGLGILFSNILYTSLLVSVIILIIICFTYPCRRGTQTYVVFKLVFYVFVAVLGILAVHQGIMEKKFEERYSNKMNKHVLEAVRGGSINTLLGSGRGVKINPLFADAVVDNVADIAAADTIGSTYTEGDQHDGLLLRGQNPGDQNPGGYPNDVRKDNIKVSGSSVEDMLANLGA